MKNIISLTFFLLTMTSFYLPKADSFVEITMLNEISPEITQDTLVLVDLDDTIVTTETMLGSSPWWEHFTRKMMSANFDTRTTFQSVFPLVGKIVQSIPLKPIERDTPFFIRNLQAQNIIVWGLTGRVREAPYDPNFAATTHFHLQKIGIDFDASPLPLGANITRTIHPKQFAYGILFTSHQLKGPILKQFLQEINFTPAKIIMVDDLNSHLQSVEQVAQEMNIPCACFRYKRLDQTKTMFDPMIGNLQLKALLTQGYIPTDEQASSWKTELLKLKPGLAEDFYLEELIMNIKK
jgi:Protein of unknown function (DUF2608)